MAGGRADGASAGDLPAASPDDPARVVVSWSGGKDATYMLWRLRERDDVEVVELLTTADAERGRTSMHGVRRALMEGQAAALDLPLRVVELPPEPSNEVYEERMAAATVDYADRGVDRLAFADLFLEDVREYREERLADAAVAGWWPVWGTDTTALAREFVDAGFAATLVCVEDALADLAGERFAEALAALPDGVDPCGEHGEFHTFVHDGPLFDAPVAVERGDVVTREVAEGTTLHYCDLLAAGEE